MSKVPSTSDEIRAFRHLLCAMYHQPYKLCTYNDLEDLFRIADFYCALPILSNSLTAVLLRSDIFTHRDTPSALFISRVFDAVVMAKRLRQPVFFKDCLIHIVGQWNSNDTRVKDPEILNIVLNAYGRLCIKMMEMQHNLFLYTVTDEEIFAQEANDDSLDDFPHGVRDPEFCRYVLKALRRRGRSENPEFDTLSKSITDLLKNNLALDQRDPSDIHAHGITYYVSADIQENELPWNPWDTEAVDW